MDDYIIHEPSTPPSCASNRNDTDDVDAGTDTEEVEVWHKAYPDDDRDNGEKVDNKVGQK